MPQFESHFFSSLIFWEVVSFGILLFVLYKFAFPGILSALEEREKKIKDSLDQAEMHRSAAEAPHGKPRAFCWRRRNGRSVSWKKTSSA